MTGFQLLCVAILQFVTIQWLRTIHHDLNTIKGIGTRMGTGMRNDMNTFTISDKLSNDELSSLEKATGVSRWRIGRIIDNPMTLQVGVDRTLVKFSYIEFVDNDDIAPLLNRFPELGTTAPARANAGTGFFERIREWWNRRHPRHERRRPEPTRDV